MAALLVITSITSHGPVEMNQCLSTLSTVSHGQWQQQGNYRSAQCTLQWDVQPWDEMGWTGCPCSLTPLRVISLFKKDTQLLKEAETPYRQC